ncbi:hypothetical protein M0Q28_05485 [Patescibacteria group bacterium]|jgi:hypothetical protein|nr:hypothetical protein [Patescibacteria group bacterium]
MTEKIYIGTKIIAAEPMEYTRFCQSEGRACLAVETHGYRVRYEDGHVSWSPKEVFERCYREVSDVEQRLVLFAGDKWPEGGAPGPLRLNVIGKPNADHIRESLGKFIPESEWPEGIKDAVRGYEKESKS